MYSLSGVSDVGVPTSEADKNVCTTNAQLNLRLDVQFVICVVVIGDAVISTS
jgi:hypothetical protein